MNDNTVCCQNRELTEPAGETAGPYRGYFGIEAGAQWAPLRGWWGAFNVAPRFYRSLCRTQSVILERSDRISAQFPPE